MSRCIDLTGQRFGKLVVLERAENGAGRIARWRCRCDCGRETVVYGTSLRRGITRSCGSKGCRAYRRKDDRYRPTLCWACKKAVCGCSWSRSFTPVEGWDAVPTTVYVQNKPPAPSYRVLACPLFERDG